MKVLYWVAWSLHGLLAGELAAPIPQDIRTPDLSKASASLAVIVIAIGLDPAFGCITSGSPATWFVLPVAARPVWKYSGAEVTLRPST